MPLHPIYVGWFGFIMRLSGRLFCDLTALVGLSNLLFDCLLWWRVAFLSCWPFPPSFLLFLIYKLCWCGFWFYLISIDTIASVSEAQPNNWPLEPCIISFTIFYFTPFTIDRLGWASIRSAHLKNFFFFSSDFYFLNPFFIPFTFFCLPPSSLYIYI